MCNPKKSVKICTELYLNRSPAQLCAKSFAPNFSKLRFKLTDLISKPQNEAVRLFVQTALCSCRRHIEFMFRSANILPQKVISKFLLCLTHQHDIMLSRSDCGLTKKKKKAFIVGCSFGWLVRWSVSWSALFYILRGLQTSFWHRR